MKFFLGWLSFVVLQYVMFYVVIGDETIHAWSTWRVIAASVVMMVLNMSGWIEGRHR